MTEEHRAAANMVTTAFAWGPFVQGWLVAIGTFLAGLWPFLRWVKKRRQAREDEIRNEMRRKLEEEQAREKEKSAKHVEIEDFEAFKKENRGQHDELGHIVQQAAQRASDANESIKQIAEKMRADNESHAHELRETLQVFKMGIDTSLGDVHEKANSAKLEVAKIEGRVDALERRQAS